MNNQQEVESRYKEAYEKLIAITKNQIEILKKEDSTYSLDTRQELLEFFQNRLLGHSSEIRENQTLSTLRTIAQTARQKYQNALLQ